MSNFYWIHANITGQAKWHLVYAKYKGLYFVESDFSEDDYDIETYRVDFPNNEVVEIPNVHEIKNPLGICDAHKSIWHRVDCPLCDALFLYDRLKVATAAVEKALEQLTYPGMKSCEEMLQDAQKPLNAYLRFAAMGGEGTCTCDDSGEGRCPRHGWEELMKSLRVAKEKK